MAEGVKRLLIDGQYRDEFDSVEKAVIRYRPIIVVCLLILCFYQFVLGNKNNLFYLVSAGYIFYLSIIEIISKIQFFEGKYDSHLFRIVRVEINILFSSILLFLGGGTFEFYLLLIPWIIASVIFFIKIDSLIIALQVAAIYMVISLNTFEIPFEDVHLSSTITRMSVLFLIWWLSCWWWEKRMLSQERRNRLQVLHEFLKEAVNLNIKELFEKVVELTYDQLNSEESALFLQDPNDPKYVTKVALKALTLEVERKLLNEEKKYRIGDSLTGCVFEKRGSIIERNVEECLEANKENVETYKKIIPSGRILHYIGVPLIVEEEVLGVLRVINRKGSKYSLDNKNFQLSKKGFDEWDKILLEIIAGEVAVAIKNAKIKNYLDHLLDNTDEAVIAVDRKGMVQKLNRSAETITGYNEEEVKGRHVEKLYKDKQEPRRIMRLLREAGDKRVFNIESAIKNIKGEIIPIDLSVYLLYDETGEWLGSIGLFRDLRKMKELQDKVIQSERMAAMGILARSVGHELKHDFNSIILYAEALDELAEKDTEVCGIAKEIINVSDKGTDKLNKMLKAVRPQTPEMKPWPVKELFEDITCDMREKSRLKGVVFDVQYTDHLPKIRVDSKQLKEVFENLFSNSLDAAGIGGEIKLFFQQEEDKLVICWENTGKDIPEKDIPILFDPFFTTKKGGTGLGLSLVQMIIINHGGRIWVDPAKQNGARFCIELPASND